MLPIKTKINNETSFIDQETLINSLKDEVREEIVKSGQKPIFEVFAISAVERTEQEWSDAVNTKIKASSIPNKENYHFPSYNTLVQPEFIKGLLNNSTNTGLFEFFAPLGNLQQFYKPRLNNSYFVAFDIQNISPEEDYSRMMYVDSFDNLYFQEFEND